MVYTSYSASEYESLPKRYQRAVVGIRDSGEIIQVPVCPLCGGEMANLYDNYLSCLDCGEIRKIRVLSDV